jgi:hypothetical protein
MKLAQKADRQWTAFTRSTEPSGAGRPPPLALAALSARTNFSVGCYRRRRTAIDRYYGCFLRRWREISNESTLVCFKRNDDGHQEIFETELLVQCAPELRLQGQKS